MTLLPFPCFPSHSSISSSPSPIFLCSFYPISSFSAIRKKPISATIIPARDRTIDFGKHRGKMLGTLPSKYLKWVSETLRARDFEEWAKLADEVLGDPVYRDRLEWEFAQNILNGDIGDGSSIKTESPVSDLLEISERFGWDNEDKLAWNRIDFALLGTSKGGRIPRRGSSRVSKFEQMGSLRTDSRVSPTNSQKERKSGFLSKGSSRVSGETQEVGCVSGRREERRERLRLKRGLQMHKVRLKIGGNKKKDDLDHHDQDDAQDDEDKDHTVKNNFNLFPGREALIRKVLNGRRASH